MASAACNIRDTDTPQATRLTAKSVRWTLLKYMHVHQRWNGDGNGDGVVCILWIGWDGMGSGRDARLHVQLDEGVRRAGFPRSWTPDYTIIITRTTSYGRCQGSMKTEPA